MSYWRRISPRGAIADFIAEWRQPRPYRWHVLGLAVALTFTMMVLLIPESQPIPPARPDVTYITTWQEGRTDEEIAASNAANQVARRREAFRALGQASGFDVDELERQFADDKPAEEATAAQAAEPTPETPPAGE